MFRIFLVLSLLLVSCQPKLNLFQQTLSEDYDKYTDRQKSIFNSFYTLDSAEKEAHNYCNQLKQGKVEGDIENDIFQPILKKLDSKKITKEEAADVMFVKSGILKFAIPIYCPEFGDKTPSLKDRLNSK